MKKLSRIVLISLLLSIVLSLSAFALQDGAAEDYVFAVNEELSSLLDGETRELLSSLGFEDGAFTSGVEISWKTLLSFFRKDAASSFRETLRPFALSLVLVLVFSFVSLLVKQGSGEALETAAVCIAIMQNVSVLQPLLSAGTTLLHTSASFVKGFLPIYAGLVAFSGAPASALGVQTLIFSLCEGITALSETLCLRVTGAFLGVSIACAISSHVRMPKLIAGANRAMNWVLGLLCAVFTGVLGTKSVLSAAADSAAGKSVRFLLGSTIPIVGAAMSDAYSSIVASIHLIRGSVALVGVIALLVLHVPVLLQALAAMFSYKLLCAVCDAFGTVKLSSVFQCFALALKFVLLLGVLELFLFLIAIGLLLQVKGGI